MMELFRKGFKTCSLMDDALCGRIYNISRSSYILNAPKYTKN